MEKINGIDKQIVYINIDDSGKLVDSEKVSIYAGLVFISKKEKDKFITQYRSIVKDIRCKKGVGTSLIIHFTSIFQISAVDNFA